jgi:hypothetical protein
MHPEPGRHLSDVCTRQHRPNRVQPLLDLRQDNQCQSRPPRVSTPHGDVDLTVAEPGPVSQISWRTAVAHHPTEDKLSGGRAVRTFQYSFKRPPARTLLRLRLRVLAALRASPQPQRCGQLEDRVARLLHCT